jgi:hypothetical protein
MEGVAEKLVDIVQLVSIGKPMFLTQQLGAWDVSEEEPKPKRGTRKTIKCFSGTWNVKTLKLGQKWLRA